MPRPRPKQRGHRDQFLRQQANGQVRREQRRSDTFQKQTRQLVRSLKRLARRREAAEAAGDAEALRQIDREVQELARRSARQG